MSDKAKDLPTAPTQPAPAAPVFGSDIAATTQHWQARRMELEKQIVEIEKFLGFVEVSDSLAVRVSKLEAFLGLKG